MDGTNEKKKELLLPIVHNHKTRPDHSAAKIFRAVLLSPVFIPGSFTSAMVCGGKVWLHDLLTVDLGHRGSYRKDRDCSCCMSLERDLFLS